MLQTAWQPRAWRRPRMLSPSAHTTMGAAMRALQEGVGLSPGTLALFAGVPEDVCQRLLGDAPIADARHLQTLATYFQVDVRTLRAIYFRQFPPDYSRETFAQRIKGLMQRDHWSTQALAERLGVPFHRVELMRGGKPVTESALLGRMAEIFGEDPDDLRLHHLYSLYPALHGTAGAPFVHPRLLAEPIQPTRRSHLWCARVRYYARCQPDGLGEELLWRMTQQGLRLRDVAARAGIEWTHFQRVLWDLICPSDDELLRLASVVGGHAILMTARTHSRYPSQGLMLYQMFDLPHGRIDVTKYLCGPIYRSTIANIAEFGARMGATIDGAPWSTPGLIVYLNDYYMAQGVRPQLDLTALPSYREGPFAGTVPYLASAYDCTRAAEAIARGAWTIFELAWRARVAHRHGGPWTRAEVAKQMGVHARRLGQIEGAQRLPTPPELAGLYQHGHMSAFGLQPADLKKLTAASKPYLKP